MKTVNILYGIVIFSFGPVLLAQSSKQESDKRNDAIKVERTLAISDAYSLLAAGDVDGADEVLRSLAINSKRESGHAHIQAATLWMRLGFMAKARGDHKLAIVAALRAEQSLKSAEKYSRTDLATLAMIQEQRGIICERLAGTTAEAIANYREAIRIKPGSAFATEKLKQLEATEEKRDVTVSSNR